MGMSEQRGSRESAFMDPSEEAKLKLATEIEDATDNAAAPFESKFAPSDMRQLALVAHNHMKPAMKEFIETYSEVLQKFRITGTQTTMRMCKSLWGEDDPKIEYGLTCTSGPLGGDAQVAALMCMEDLGGLIFFVDPLSAHPHQADIDSLIRLCNCGNVIVCPNPTSAMALIHTLRMALETGNRGMIPSFFTTLESPAVEEYKNQQELALAAAVAAGGNKEPEKPAGLMESLHNDIQDDIDDFDTDDFDTDEVDDAVKEVRRMSLVGGSAAPTSRPNRGSMLTGFKTPEQSKKKKGILKKVMKKLGA